MLDTSTQATSPFPDNNVDNDNNAVNFVNGNVFSNAITLTEGGEPINDGDGNNSNLTFDLALCGTSFIGDFVWNDLNGNGIQETGEPGLNGQTVTITFADGRMATTTTLTFNGQDGYYDFKNLGPDTYKITFTTPLGFAPTISNVPGDDRKDSDPVNGSVNVTIAANISDFTVDAGFGAPMVNSVGNLVFIDLNGNGTRDLTEPGVPGLVVNLYRDTNGDNIPDGIAISSTVSGSDGSYKFISLSASNYIVGVVLSVGYDFIGIGNTTPNNDIDNDNNAVRIAAGEVFTNAISLASGTEPTTDGDDNNSNSTLDIGLKVNANCKVALIGDAVEGFTVNKVAVYPNPTVKNFTLNISAEKKGFATIWIVDPKGRSVMSKNLNLIPGTNIVQMNAETNMPSGIYTIQTMVNGQLISKRLVVNK